MGFALVGYQFRQFEIKRVSDEDVLLADARLSVVQLDTIVSTATSRAARQPQLGKRPTSAAPSS